MIISSDTQTQSLSWLNKTYEHQIQCVYKNTKFSTKEGATLISTDCLFVCVEDLHVCKKKKITSLALVFEQFLFSYRPKNWTSPL